MRVRGPKEGKDTLHGSEGGGSLLEQSGALVLCFLGVGPGPENLTNASIRWAGRLRNSKRSSGFWGGG